MAVFIPCPGGSWQRRRDSAHGFVQLLLLDKQGTCYIYQIAFSFLLLIGWVFSFLRVPFERTSWTALFLETVKLMVESGDGSD